METSHVHAAVKYVMKNKATSDLNRPPPPSLAATDFYDLKLPLPKLSETQLQDRPLGNLVDAFKLHLPGRTNSQLRAAAAELGRVIEPVRNAKRVTTRFRALLYALVHTDLASIEGFPGAMEEELMAVLGLLLLQEYVQIPGSQTSGQQSLNSLAEREAQVFEAWACAFHMSKINQRVSAEYGAAYASSAQTKFKSLSAHNKTIATTKNAPFRNLEKEVIKRFRKGQEVEGKLKCGQWKSAKQAGELIYEEMKKEPEKWAKIKKKSGKEAASFLIDDSDAAHRMEVYIGNYLRKKRASEALAKLGISSTWNPDENEFVPHLNQC